MAETVKYGAFCWDLRVGNILNITKAKKELLAKPRIHTSTTAKTWKVLFSY